VQRDLKQSIEEAGDKDFVGGEVIQPDRTSQNIMKLYRM